MKVLVLQCDRRWDIASVLRNTFDADVRAGDRLTRLVPPDQASELEAASDLEYGHALVTLLRVRGIDADLPSFALPFHEHFLVVVSNVEGPGAFKELLGELKGWLSWADITCPCRIRTATTASSA